MTFGKPVLQVRDLSVRFPARRDALGRAIAYHDALRGFSMNVAMGECVGIVGESGSGKTTVANAVVGFVEPCGGEIEFAGYRLPALARRDRTLTRKIQMVFQDPQGSLDPRVRVRDTIGEGLAIRGADQRAQRVRVDEIAGLVGLDVTSLDQFPHAFSGGQRQRIAIARALVVEPSLVLLDEPTSALDVSVQAQVLNLLLDLQARLGLTYVLISHDISVVAHLCHRIVVMRAGEIVEQGPTATIIAAPQHPYTQSLIASVPTVGTLAAGVGPP